MQCRINQPVQGNTDDWLVICLSLSTWLTVKVKLDELVLVEAEKMF